MVAPYAWQMAWWPRQTPSIGTVPFSSRATSTITPASSGRPGPGDRTIRSGCSARISSSVSSSLRITRMSASIDPIACTRLYEKLS